MRMTAEREAEIRKMLGSKWRASFKPEAFMEWCTELLAELAETREERNNARGRLLRAEIGGRAVPIVGLHLQAAGIVPEHPDEEIDDGVARLVAERDALAAQLKRIANPFLPAHDREPLSDEDMAAIRARWGTGPERYQADADALIGEVLRLRRAETSRCTGCALLPLPCIGSHVGRLIDGQSVVEEIVEWLRSDDAYRVSRDKAGFVGNVSPLGLVSDYVARTWGRK